MGEGGQRCVRWRINGLCAPLIPADPVPSAGHLPGGLREAEVSNRLGSAELVLAKTMTPLRRAAAAMMMMDAGGGVVSGRRPTTNWLEAVLEDDGRVGGGGESGGSRGSVPSQTSQKHSTSHPDGLTAGQSESRAVAPVPLPSRPTKLQPSLAQGRQNAL